MSISRLEHELSDQRMQLAGTQSLAESLSHQMNVLRETLGADDEKEDEKYAALVEILDAQAETIDRQAGYIEQLAEAVAELQK
jgi:hypothetical protein